MLRRGHSTTFSKSLITPPIRPLTMHIRTLLVAALLVAVVDIGQYSDSIASRRDASRPERRLK